MAQTTIAIVADCDDTLAPDTTAQLLELCGVDSRNFFREHAAPRVKEGWDPSLAYMQGMIDLARNEGPLASLTQTRIKELAKQLEFYPGVPECFTSIKDDIERDARFRAAGVRVEFTSYRAASRNCCGQARLRMPFPTSGGATSRMTRTG